MSYKEKISIISGSHRGRKIQVPQVTGLRPTPSRIRETLFNWLTPYLNNASCLDWFAGSGILGFEALSRGAKQVDFIDQSPVAIGHIKKHLDLLLFRNASAISQDYKKVFTQEKSYDIIFVDPPYQSRLLPDILSQIDQLKPKLIYIEDNQPIESIIENTPSLNIEKHKKAGSIYYGLLSINKA